jgi:hypothetical protein
VDTSLGCDWHFNDNSPHVDFVISSFEFANNISYYEGVVLREENEQNDFLEWCDAVDKSIEESNRIHKMTMPKMLEEKLMKLELQLIEM